MLNVETPDTMSCPQDTQSWSWMGLAYMSIATIKNGFALLLIALCLYNLSKLTAVQKVWEMTRGLLPEWSNERIIDKRINAMTAELRMEMRKLSQQLVEFQKWPQILNDDVPGHSKFMFCQQCRERMLPPAELPMFKRRTGIHPTVVDSEINERIWPQYLHKYVYPNPRILDTDEMENTKRAYSM